MSTFWPGVGEQLEQFAERKRKSATDWDLSSKLRPIFGKLQEGGRVDLVQLRASLITVNVSISAAKMLDLLHLADSEGRVMLEYNDYEDLMLSIPGGDPLQEAARSQSIDYNWEDRSDNNKYVPLVDMPDDSPDQIDVSELFNFSAEEEAPKRATESTAEYLARLSGQADNLHTPVKDNNWQLMLKHQTGEWKSAWSYYDVETIMTRGGWSKVQRGGGGRTVQVKFEDAMKTLRVVSSLEPVKNGTALSYVDTNLG